MSVSRGQRVALRRRARKWSQEDLAYACGCSLRTIQRIESDECASITGVLIAALRKHLGISLRELGEAARRGRGA